MITLLFSSSFAGAVQPLRWLLPGIFCVLVMIGLLDWYLVFWANIAGWMADSWFEDEKGPPVT